ncbi:MAG: hypothetical protein QOK11_4103 [Pseudonocardiales bacterium]|nr:hypothetical protein [Pseudonocardiales bacterium]MDT4945803.1 hypothetical protein [Pseudonocardiales bacterium]
MVHMSGHAQPGVLTLAMVSALTVALAPASAAAAPSTNSAADSGPCGAVATFDPGRFPSRPAITNRWLPLVPGANFVLHGSVREDDGLLHDHRILTTVTDLTKVINGVRTLVIFERDIQDGELQESELAFEAQDNSGRVWNVGEYPEEYEGRHLVGAPSTWIAGIDGAVAGIAMLDRPRPGAGPYLQGYAPQVDFFDCAEVAQTGLRVCVTAGCFQNVLVIDEWAPLDPAGGHQLKYYAAGLGAIKVGAVGGTSAEVLQLEKVTQLSADELTTIRDEVIRQDRRGRHVSKDVYAQTAPLQRLCTATAVG